jgi:hypothetical protein
MRKGSNAVPPAPAFSGHTGGGPVEHTLSSRPISNGHIVRTSIYDHATGESSSREEFHANPPRIAPAAVMAPAKRAAGTSRLAAAVKHLKG